MLLPRPIRVSGRFARPREAHQRAQLEGVVRGREQVGRPADPHRGQLSERHPALRLHTDPARDLAGQGDEIERGRGTHGAHRFEPAVPAQLMPPLRPVPWRCGRRRPRPAAARRSARASRISAIASAAPGRPSARAAAAIAACRAGSSRIADRGQERGAIEVLVGDERRGARAREGCGVGPLVGARVWVRHDDHREAERGRLGERRRARPADDEVRRGERVEELLAEEHRRSVTATHGLRERIPPRERADDALRAGDVDHDMPARRVRAAHQRRPR